MKGLFTKSEVGTWCYVPVSFVFSSADLRISLDRSPYQKKENHFPLHLPGKHEFFKKTQEKDTGRTYPPRWILPGEGLSKKKKSKLNTFSTSSQTTLLVHNVLCCAYVPVVYITAMSPCTANTCVYLSIDRYTYITIYMCISIYIYTRV